MKKRTTAPTKKCIKCGSKNVLMIHEGLETDLYKCRDCGKEWLVTDFRRIAGYTREECEEMDRKNKRKDLFKIAP